MQVFAKSLVLSNTFAIPKSPSRIFKKYRVIKDDSRTTYLAIFKENILGLHVSMQDLSLVEVEHRERHLNEPVEDLVLRKVFAFA
jgi:hypothetical protein